MNRALTSRRIVLVDNDRCACDRLFDYLVSEGFQVLLAGSVAALSRILLHEAVDLIVLEVQLPDGNGLSICQRLRAANNSIPIILLMARSSDWDRIAGLEAGADDYMCKPFNSHELCARIHAILSRQPRREAAGAPSIGKEVIRFGAFVFDLGARTLFNGAVRVPLTTTQFAILKALVRHAGQILSRNKLAQLTRNRDLQLFDRSLDVQISRLRKLLGVEDPAAVPGYIQTVRGVGYVFKPDCQDVRRGLSRILF